MTEPISLNVARADRENDNSLLSPVDALREAIRDIENGEYPAERILILRLDHGEDGNEFNVGWHAANINSTMMIALMEAVKHRLLTDVGFGDR